MLLEVFKACLDNEKSPRDRIIAKFRWVFEVCNCLYNPFIDSLYYSIIRRELHDHIKRADTKADPHNNAGHISKGYPSYADIIDHKACAKSGYPNSSSVT